MRVVQVKCPQCNSAITMKQKDTLFFCPQCSTIHIRDGGVEKLDYEIADFNPNIQGDRWYVPFWRVYASFVVHNKNVQGGTAFKLFSWLKGSSDSGNMFIYIPATELDSGTFRRLSSMLTMNPPRYATRLNFGNVNRVSANVSRREAAELADFVVVTMEADQPGILQTLNYTLTVNDTKLVYLPFIKTTAGLQPAI